MPNCLRLRFLLPRSFGLVLMLLLLVSVTQEVQATHLRAGDITAKRDTTPNPNPLRFFFKMVIYTDRSSQAEDLRIDVNMGDGTIVNIPRGPVRQISPETDQEIFTWEHTYPAPSTYRVRWVGVNRNGRILNLQAPTDMHSFYLETTININPFRPFNSTPVLQYPPIDIATTGQRFVHNPAAFDRDGDSLSFKIIPPRRQAANSTNIIPVPGYTLPSNLFGCSNADGTAPATFTLDPVTGQMVWDAPCRQGEYNVAFIVEEWRVSAAGAVMIGSVVRDMQITVREGPNRPPVLERKDTCIVAGTKLDWLVRATDPDNDLIELTAISAIIPPATFNPKASNATTRGLAEGDFSWSTTCNDVRAQPYQVIFRAQDRRQSAADRLVDLQPWSIRVVGPPPQNLVVTRQGKNVQVNWDSYTCQNAATIRIYRREGPSNFVPDHCETGVPASTGYVMIGEVPKDRTSFLDTNSDQGLESGKEYCYIIYAEFPAPRGGQSLASAEACIVIEQDIPFLTNVTVDATSATAGQVTVKWTQPGPGISLLTGPFQYRLYRKVGQDNTDAGYTLVKTTGNLADTTFVDTNLNTEANAYRYKLEFYQSETPGGPPTSLYETTSASSVRLEAVPSETEENFITLNWTYNVPWRNEVLRHKIYRQINGNFVLIDSVMATAGSGTYTDRGTYNGIALARGQTYCYYVQTAGTYQNDFLPEPLLNNSQEVCAAMIKLVCAPELSIDVLDCESFLRSPSEPPYQNVLTWVPNITGDCTDEIAFYTVYFKPTLDAEYASLGTTTETTFTHTGLESFAGCYRVTATDVLGRESDFSNEECKDNCIEFMLPNIITPNGDGKNDVFRPTRRTVFVRSMRFVVYNRWGVKVYEGNDRNINWGGVTTDGSRVTDGTYYYEAEVEFFTVDPARQRATYKGWVQIVR